MYILLRLGGLLSVLGQTPKFQTKRREREERREAAEGAEAVDGRDLLPGVDSDDEDLGEDALYQLAMEWSSDYLVHDG